MVKTLVFDLDGTIVSPNTGTYSPAIADALHELHKKGIILIAATGRSPYELQITKMINGLHFDAIVSLNGQYCYSEDNNLFANPFPYEQTDRLLQIIENSGFPCAVIQKEGTFINTVNPHVRIAQAEIRMPVPEIRKLDSFYNKEILMLTVFVPKQDETKFLESLESVVATRWNPYAMDLVPEGSGKCQGVEVVLKSFGISWDEVYAFGDGENDYEMLKRSVKGIAMGNSARQLLNGEFEVADHVDNDGVLKILQKYQIL